MRHIPLFNQLLRGEKNMPQILRTVMKTIPLKRTGSIFKSHLFEKTLRFIAIYSDLQSLMHPLLQAVSQKTCLMIR